MSEKIVDSEQQPVEDKKPEDYFFRASAKNFKKIPDSPIAYWISKNVIKSFDAERVEKWTISEGQNKTANNDKYVRNVWEPSRKSLGKNTAVRLRN